MTSNRFESLERRRLLQVAKEYKEKGYTVEIEPSQTPDFLRNHSPDLIARSEDDNVVIEVVSKQTISKGGRLLKIAKAVEEVPGWRFEVVVTNPKEKRSQDISSVEIETRISEAKRLAQSGSTLPSLLLMWSAIEPLLRRVSSDEQGRDKSISSVRLVKTLFSLGLLTRTEYEHLSEAAEYRNQVSHGFVPEDEISAERTLANLLIIGDKLLDRIERPIVRETKDYSAEDLVEWFYDNFEDPSEGVPYEGGYIYVHGGPYDAWEELASQFPDADEETVQEAVDQITPDGTDWVRKGQY